MEDSFGCMQCDLYAAFFIAVEFQSINQPFELYSFASSLSVASSFSSRLLQTRLQAPHSIVVMMMIIIRHRSLNYYYYYYYRPPCLSLSSYHHTTLPPPTHGRFGLWSSCNISCCWLICCWWCCWLNNDFCTVRCSLTCSVCDSQRSSV